MVAQHTAKSSRSGAARLQTGVGTAGLRLAHACCLLFFLTLAWGPHWPFSHYGIAAPPAGLLNAGFDLADLLLVAILAGWGVALVTGQDRVQVRPRWISVPLLLFVLATLLAVPTALDQAEAIRFAVRTAGLAALYLYLRCCFDAQRLTVTSVARWLAPGLALNGLLATAQIIHQDPLGLSWLGEPRMLRSTPGTAVLLVHGQRVLRAFGVLPHANVLGGLLAAALPLIAVAIIRPAGIGNAPMATNRRRQYHATERGRRLPSFAWLTGDIWLLLCLALMLAGLVFSFSRSAWLGLLAGLLYLACRRGGVRLRLTRRALLAGAGIAIVIAGLLIVEWDAVSVRLWPASNRLEQLSIQQRLALQDLTFKVIAWRPLTGVGGNNLGLAEARFQPPARDRQSQLLPVHNTYLLAQAELGPLGAGSWLALMLVPLAGLRRRRRDLRQALAGCSLVVVAAVGLFDFYIWANEPVAVLWITALAAFVVPSCPEQRRLS